MTSLFKVFVSSVQKELEDERLLIQNLVNTDPFLSAHCTPVLYEYEPASAEKALEGCLKSLNNCQVYLLIVGVQYGTPADGLSITHTEYRFRKLVEMGLAEKLGAGRSTRYRLKSWYNRQVNSVNRKVKGKYGEDKWHFQCLFIAKDGQEGKE